MRQLSSPRYSLYAAILILTGCGGGSSSPVSQNPSVVAPSSAVVTLQSSVPEAVVNDEIVVTWSSSGASGCIAGGGWSGDLPISGSQNVRLRTVGVVVFSLTCGGVTTSVSVAALSEYVSIPDVSFLDALVRLGFGERNGELLRQDVRKITNLCVTSLVGFYGVADAKGTAVFENPAVPDAGVRCAYTTTPIKDLTGLDAFVNLKTFRIEAQLVESVNLQPLKNLVFFSLWKNPIKTIDLTKNPNLEIVGVSETSLETLDLSSLVKLRELNAQNGSTPPFVTTNGVRVPGLKSIVFPKTNTLKLLFIYGNRLEELDLRGNPGITQVSMEDNKIVGLDLSYLENLNYFIAGDSSLQSLNLSGLKASFYRLFVTCSPNLRAIRVWDPTTIVGGGYNYLSLPPSGKDRCDLGQKGFRSQDFPNVVFVNSQVTFTN